MKPTARLHQRTWRRVQAWVHPPRQRLRDPQVNRFRLELPRLAPELAGLRIVHLSDIHYGVYLSRRALARALDLAQSLRPDLIALTGDFVTQSPAFIEPVAEMLGRLRAPLGVYAVLGNHDFRAGAARVTAELGRRRIHVLRNRHLFVERGGVRFKIAGIDDFRQRPDLRAALGTGTEDGFTLLLAHNPAVLPEAAAAGVDLVLAGHTHGGQIKFRFARSIYQRYLPEGFLSEAGTRMYVSRGLGQVILPLRVGCPPELACFVLQPT